MKRSARVTLAPGTLAAQLDASELFAEAREDEAEYRARLAAIYGEVFAMRAASQIDYEACVPGIVDAPAQHMRLVWHFAGSCAAGRVVNAHDFSVLGTRGLHVVDASVCRVCPDGGAMALAYLTGTLAAGRMADAGI